MQEFQSIPGLASRLFGGSGAPELRRAQAQQGPGARCGGAAAAPEAVKCPRCESTNTKFCYYNNYNLSQPRHFCKSCRRYWTKGGVLRNVPVGGGCRKAKRSSSSTYSSPAASSAPSTPSASEAKNPRRASASSPRSNSGSTSPKAAAATTTSTTPATPSSSNNTAAITGHSTNPFSSSVDVAPPAPIFADQAAALASLFAPPPPPPLPVFSFTAQPKDGGDVASVVLPHETAASTSADMAPFTSLDAGIFEQLGDASSSAYWNAGSCWTDVQEDQDPSVYLP